MAKVQIGQVGQTLREVEADTVGEALSNAGYEGSYTVNVNGSSADMEDTLREGDFLSVGQKVKGGGA